MSRARAWLRGRQSQGRRCRVLGRTDCASNVILGRRRRAEGGRVADDLPYRSSALAMSDEGEEECSEGKNDESRSHNGEIESLDTWVIAVI
jgi:hypothetical protein